MNEGTGAMLRRAGLGLLVGVMLMAPSVSSAAPALVFEPYNGTVLYAEDPDAQWFPASLTKLMTAYVTFQALKAGTVSPDTKVVCTDSTPGVATPRRAPLALATRIERLHRPRRGNQHNDHCIDYRRAFARGLSHLRLAGPPSMSLGP